MEAAPTEDGVRPEAGGDPGRSRSAVKAAVIVAIVLLVLLLLGMFFLRDGGDLSGGDGRVAITLLQMNDVYELTPVSGGAEGGLARVASVRNSYVERNPNTLTILAGDLLNPSALGTATVDGERLAGRQMVDVMNELGLDYATFGNHEFDLSEQDFRKRLAESRFEWFSSNVSAPDGSPFPDVPRNVTFSVKDEDGDQVRVGMFGVTVASNPKPWLKYDDPVEVARTQVAGLREQVDILIAVTHLPLTDDIRLVQEVPGIDLVVGGHEHENSVLARGRNFTPIVKADANARTLQVHELVYDTGEDRMSHSVRLRRITVDDSDDPEVARRVDRWVNAAFEGFRSQGFDPERVVTRTTDDLDGTEAGVRNRPTRLTELIASSMIRASGSAEVAVYNSGSIRIDDVIPAGPVTEYDVIRTLPFGGRVLSMQMRGDLLRQLLDDGRNSAGTGSYLQTANVAFTDQWMVNGAPLDPARTYNVALNDFLLDGSETRPYLNRSTVANVADHGDVREALIDELKATYG